VVVEGNRILTNAHVVAYASEIQIQANQSGDKISATVEFTSPGIDLAVLKLDDTAFFLSHPPLPRLSALPSIKDAVLAYGYPTGGNSLSITKGIVSRIEFSDYNFPVCGLRIQIDAAINPGNSGGPALVGDKMVGVAFSRLNNADNIGYIIPNEEIDLFLKGGSATSAYAKPHLFDSFQPLESPALRSFLHLDSSIKGVVVNEPFSGTPNNPLKKWDVVTKIGSSSIDDQGMVQIGGNIRVRFQYLVQKFNKEGMLGLTLLRNGKEVVVQVSVSASYPRVIPSLEGTYPSYFIYGPIVFSSASAEMSYDVCQSKYTQYYTALESPLLSRRMSAPSFDGEELVVISSPFFPSKLSNGYKVKSLRAVKSINGIRVNNLLHLVEILRDSKEPFSVIEFYDLSTESLVLPHAETLAATDGILADNGIRAQGSPDLLKVLSEKKGK
jgi:S1-C subfamily serine protease